MSDSGTRGPRVLHVITALGVGGVEVWLLALLRHMRSLRDSTTEVESFDICLTGGRKADLDDLASTLGARLHYVRFGRDRMPIFAREFRRILRNGRYDVIHDHQDYASAWHLLAGLGLLPPVRIVHVHNPPMCLRIATNTPLRRGLFRIARRVVGRLATHILGTSRQALAEFGFNSALFQSQVVRPLHCGFDVGDFNTPHGDAKRDLCGQFEWPADSRICLFVGRLDGIDPSQPLWNHKNPQFALDVVRHAIASDPRIKFVIVGGGEDARTSLEARVREWGLSDVIRFVGSRLDVPQFMAAADLLLFPSSEEGLGMVAVEAQAAGLRVLASATVPHEAVVLQELVTFRSLDEGPVSWAAQLCRLLDLPRFDVARANNAVRESEFSVDNSYRALQSIYASRTRGVPPSRASRKRK